jgi:hypothetical protein
MRREASVQVLADQLLAEVGRRIDSREIAEELLRRELVSSNAANPWYSIATTIEKNIRDGRYNEPKLAFVLDERGRPRHGKTGRRLIQRAAWVSGVIPEASAQPVGLNGYERRTMAGREGGSTEATTLLLRVPDELLARIQLAQLAGFGATQEEAAVVLLERGLNASRVEIGSEIKQRFNI